jgi:hypothetical protein
MWLIPLPEGAKHTFISCMERTPESEKKNTSSSPNARADLPEATFRI